MSTESYNGNYAAEITYSHTDEANLVSPNFILPASSFISYMWKDDDMISAKIVNHDTTFFEISTDNGANWTTLDFLAAASSETSYHIVEHNLSAYAGTFKFRFRDVSDGTFSAYGTGIDSIVIKVVTCPAPTALNVQNLTATSANLAWTTGGAATWNVLFGVAGFDTTGLGPLAIDITTNPLLVDTLTANTSYEFYVRDRCAVDDSSTWVGPFQFTTTASCPTPTDLTATNITATRADLTWNGYFATNWDVLFGVAGFDTTGMAISANDITTNPLTVDTLLPTTSYEFYVRADCGTNNIDTSLWVGPFSFTTACSPLAPITTINWINDLETATICDFEIIDNNMSGNNWYLDNVSNIPSGNFSSTGNTSGTCFIAVSDGATSDIDASLITPAIYLTQAGLTNVALEFESQFQDYAGDGDAYVNISNDGKATWIELFYTSTDESTTGVVHNLDLSAYIGDTIFIEWKYVSPANAWQWAIDNIKVLNLVTDLAIAFPNNGAHYGCDFTGADEIPLFITNVGETTIATNDTIFGWYILDGNTAVADTFQFTQNLVPTDTAFFIFNQLGNLADLTTHNFKVWFNYQPGTDANQLNDTTIGTVTHYIPTVNLGGTNDTLVVSSYPHTLDAGAGFDSYLWNGTATSQTFMVTQDGWVNVLVNDSNGCDATDTVYVVLNTGINTLENINFSIYPNPNNGEFTLEAKFNTKTDLTVEMINLDGKSILSKNFKAVDSLNESIDVKNFAKGVYYIKIVNNNFVKLEKVIVY